MRVPYSLIARRGFSYEAGVLQERYGGKSIDLSNPKMVKDAMELCMERGYCVTGAARAVLGEINGAFTRFRMLDTKLHDRLVKKEQNGATVEYRRERFKGLVRFLKRQIAAKKALKQAA